MVRSICLSVGFALVMLRASVAAPPAPGSYYDVARPAAQPAARPAMKRLLATPKDETLTRLIKLRSRLRDLEMKWIDENGDEVMEAFSANLGGGRITAVSHINWTRPEREHWARITLENVGVTEFLHAADVHVGARFDARLNGEMDLTWRGLKVRQVRESLSGTAVFNTGNGSISRTRILDAFAEYSGIRALERFDFQQGTVKATCAGGNVQVEKMDLAGPLMRVSARGTTDLETDALQMRFDLWILADAANQSSRHEVRAGVGWVREMAGRTGSGDFLKIPVPFMFGGTLIRPIPVLDFGENR